jgi:hypothetical protein
MPINGRSGSFEHRSVVAKTTFCLQLGDLPRGMRCATDICPSQRGIATDGLPVTSHVLLYSAPSGARIHACGDFTENASSRAAFVKLRIDRESL